jgi:hypothetical protein
MASTNNEQNPLNGPLKPNAVGATSIFNSAYITQQNQNKLQNQLGAGRKIKKMRGGLSSSMQVPAPPSYSPNPELTQGNYTQLTKGMSNLQAESKYDNLAQPPKSGGSKRIKSTFFSKRGGYWPKWGCLSGGKKSKKNKSKRNKRKVRKTRKSRKNN